MDAQAYRRGAIATPHYLATLAGAQVLGAGGNAVDAILAANLALGVVAPYYCGYGGDLLAMVWDGALHAYRSTGRSPAAATPHLVRERTGASEMPVVGPHTVTVPGAVAGWFDLVERFGTRSFGELAARARVLAEDGFVLTRAGAFRLAGSTAIPGALGVDDRALRSTYTSVRPGDAVVQPALARTIATLAADGPAAYYRGPIGDAICTTIAAHGGVMTGDDLAAHHSEIVEPMHAGFAGADIYEMPPPTQGVTALEMLRMADALGLGHDGVDRLHLQIEIAKLALADRDAFVTDPAHMTIDPAELLADDFVASRAAAVDRRQARPLEPRPMADGGTAYLCCADGDGMCVSLIQSNFTAIGSGVHVAEWGINLHNRGASFSLDAAHCNVLAPSKLPMHTLIPAMVLRSGRPAYVFGTMGGHVQAQIHLQVLTRLLHDGDDPQRAVSAPRFAVDPASGTVSLESRFDAGFVEDLVGRGHAVRSIARVRRRRGSCPRDPASRHGLGGRLGSTRRERDRGHVNGTTPPNAPQHVPPNAARVLTVPNVLSLLRLLCAPVFLWLLFGVDHPAVAAWLLAGLGASDWVDGYIARHFDQGSELGKVLDPTADRVLLITGAVALLFEAVPAQVHVFVALVLARETVVAAVTLALAAAGARRIDVLWVGKAGTLAIMFSLPAFVLGGYTRGGWHALLEVIGWGFGVAGLALGFYAAARYVPAARVALREGRAAAVQPR